MRKRITFLILVVGLVYGQLNYEGNPLTENTEYTAEETYQHPSSKRTSRREQLPWRNTDNVLSNDGQPEGPQKLYPIFEKRLENNENAGTGQNDWSAIETQSPSFKGPIEITSTPLGGNNYDVRESSKKEMNDVKFNQGNVQSSYQTIGPAELALNNFLNSKTPEESQSYLDYFLRNVQSTASANHGTTLQVSKTQTAALGGNPQQQLISSRVDQGQSVPEASMVNSSPHGTSQSSSLLISREAVNQAPAVPSSPVLSRPYQTIQEAQSYVPDNSEYMTLPGWRHRTRRLRGGHPYASFAQPRIAGPAYHFGGPPGLHKSKAPIELIYTKPPGFNSRPPYAGPASAPNTWYPDANYPPPKKDIYWSQLYAQSYDPHYYNYIAKTGKIKPWLYGKLDPKNHEGESMWMELFHGFTKHGLKNIMTPGFLIGMTIPALTLMLGALIQSKGFARSDSSGNFVIQDEALREYTERLQRALQCYERTQNELQQSNDARDQNPTSFLLLSNCWRTNN